MAIDIGDPRTWRRRTAGGIPYRLMEGYPKFKFTDSGASAEEKYIIAGVHLGAFAFESLPIPQQILDSIGGGDAGRPLPGMGRLTTREIDAEPFDQTKPGDPMLTDSTEPDGTYSPFYVVTVSYSTREQDDEEGDGDDPETFLTHDIQAGAEYLIIPPDNVATADEGDTPDEDEQGEVRAVDANGEPIEEPETTEPELATKNNIPISKIIPTIEHTLTWTRCPNPPWGQLRYALGKLNSDRLAIFFNAPPDTVLFLGFSAKQDWEWFERKPSAGYRIRPWTLTLKFSERSLIERGRRLTWNHVYVPGKFHNRFEKIYLDPDETPPTRTLYESVPFVNAFKVDKPGDSLPDVVDNGLSGGVDLDGDGDIGVIDPDDIGR